LDNKDESKMAAGEKEEQTVVVEESASVQAVRLVAQRFTQKEGVDYNERFAPVVKYKSLRIDIVKGGIEPSSSLSL